MRETSDKQLTVYKAGAGSGKTYRLAVEYIKLLVQNPDCYRNILAVTFTNKATEEMKTRILSQLYGIWKLDPDSESYIETVTSELNVSRSHASRNARLALTNLIHHYNYFRVETIDSFFQSVLRNLARELDLTANLHIGLNDKQVEQQAVDQLIEDLQASSLELKWIMSYIRDNIDDDKGWNVIGQIKRFGENIFKDIYKERGAEVSRQLATKDFFTTFSSQLRAIKEKAHKNLLQPAEQFFDILEQHGLSVSDFSNGANGACGYFVKLRKGIFDSDKLIGKRIEAAMNGAEGWLKKSDLTASDPRYLLVVETLIPLLLNAERERPRHLKLYKSADITLKHLSQLRLLNSIDEKVRQLNAEANRFLLSDTQHLLNELIRDTDSPFIFEKIGNRIEHIMIDEFQDTSTIQWDNFKVLLKECLSHESSHDIIVGDVKQSIYRWRSGDWRLLNEIESEFDTRQLDVIPMRYNRRSDVHIIEFNNAFFTIAAQLEYNRLDMENPDEALQMKKAYDLVAQQYPENKPTDKGYVCLTLLPQKDAQTEALHLMTEHIDALTARGVPYSNMAILVRSNKTIQAIAEHYMQERPDIKMVSDEAFRLDSSLAVGILVNAMRLLLQPDDRLIKASLVKAYQRAILHNDAPESSLLLRTVDLDEQLPPAYRNSFADLAAMPMTDLAEQLFDIFQLQKLQEQSAYLCAFFDLMAQWLNEHVANMEAFLAEWDDTLHEKTIHSDEADGIRLITIHKSKGLEFDHVIIPNCDWTLNKGSLLWCTPEHGQAPFDQLPVIPVDYSEKQMKGSIFEADYLTEHLQDTVDNLNLLYVAFTRARKSLFVMARRGGNNLRSRVIEDSMPELKHLLEDSLLEGNSAEKNDVLTFTYGSLDNTVSRPLPATESQQEPQSVATGKSQNVFTTSPTSISLTMENFPLRAVFRQSNKSKDFVEGTGAEEKQKEYIRMGSVLHNIFSTVHTMADIPAAIRQLESDGVLYDDTLSRQRLADMIRRRLESPKVADWFSDRWQLFNECTILHVDDETGKVKERRPDRVMTNGQEMIVVDFKFGAPTQANLTDYSHQVSDYISLLTDMGYNNVSGYLWFVYSNQIIPVNITENHE